MKVSHCNNVIVRSLNMPDKKGCVSVKGYPRNNVISLIG